MPIMPSQAHREASIHCELKDDTLLFKEMHGTEQLGRLFEYRVQMVSTRHDIKTDDVLGKSMTVRLSVLNGATRYFNGIVTRFRNNGWRDGIATYEATIHPALWLLTRTSNCRIFEGESAIDILNFVCTSHPRSGLLNIDVRISGTTLPRSYCVQYRESDFNFVCRLLEEEGIYYFFRHEEDRHVMVLADSYGAHAEIDGYHAVRFRGEDSRESADESVVMWSAEGRIESSVMVLNDYDYENAASSSNGGLLAKSSVAPAFSQPEYEQYDYPGRYTHASIGNDYARGRAEAMRGQAEEFTARSTARNMATGGLFSLVDHPRDDQNAEYLVTGTSIDIVGQEYWSDTAPDTGMLFSSEFTAVNRSHAYRATPIMRKPFMQGPQTAMVVTESSKEISTDKYGRIKVQFHWYREEERAASSSCWVRVSQAWAGKGWGAMFIPRRGMEVVIDFLEGDPDRPLVTGCVYNSGAQPPYPLPAGETRSVIRSESSPGGGGYNEIRLEDKKGDEELFIQAEKNYNRVVKNNDTVKVGFEKMDPGDQTVSIYNDQSLKVGHDQKVSVGNTCVIEAVSSIELKVGASSVKIEPSKITIKSVQIAVESDTVMSIKASGVMTLEGALVKIN